MTTIRKALALVALLCGTAHAQTPSTFGFGTQISSGAVNSMFGAKCDVNASACTVTATAATASRTLADKLGEVLSTADVAVPVFGDAQPLLQSGLNALSAAGGGSLRLLPSRQYSIAGADLVIPSNVELFCDAGMPGVRVGYDYRTLPCALVLSPSRTVRLASRSKLRNVPIVNSALPAPATDMRSGITYVSSYAGTAVTVVGDDAQMEHEFIVGFGMCVANVGVERLIANDVRGDCINGVKNDQNHDIVRLADLHFWPFGLVNVSYGVTTFPVAGYANNGSGLIRLTLANPASPALVTGDNINLSLASGLPRSARKRWAITVIDSTHLDLVGSSWMPSATFSGTTVSGSACMTVSDNSALGIGMAVTGSGVPSGATITGIYEARVCLSSALTATATMQSFAAVPVSNSGAKVIVDLTARPGIGIEFTNGERNQCIGCFEFGHQIGLHLGTRAGWTYLPGFASDHMETEDSSTIGIYISDDAYDSLIPSPWVSGHAIALLVASSTGPAHKITGGSFNAGSTLSSIQLQSGDTTITGSTLAGEIDFGAGSVYVSNAIHSAIWNNNNIGSAPLLFPNGALPANFTAANISGPTP